MTQKCELCGTPVKVVGHTTKHYEPVGIVLPTLKNFNEDKAMTINPSSDNYKMGFNDALKLCKKAYSEAQPLVELDEIKSNILYRHKVSPNNFEEYLNDSFRNIQERFATKSEPVKMTVEELVNVTRPFWKYKDDMNFIITKLTEEEAIEICQAIADYVNGGKG